MASLRPLIAQGRKRIGFLIGAGAPAEILHGNPKTPLIPAVAGLTQAVLTALQEKHGAVLNALMIERPQANIETLLSRIRSLASVIERAQIHGLNGIGYKTLSDDICSVIGKLVDRRLPTGTNAYTDLVSWISGTDREHAVEVFTTNYDMLFEEALERAGIPFFDGFSGAREPFFDPSSVSSDDLPARWTRVWKLHGSLGWKASPQGEVIRVGGSESTHLVFPEHLKYELTQKAPYSALFDRLKTFLRTPDTLLITTGFSFADAHISAVISECLSANQSANVFAFQYSPFNDASCAADVAAKRGNMSVFCPDKAMINGIVAPWKPGKPPTRDWETIRATYWSAAGGGVEHFTLGEFGALARFFASSRSAQGLLSLPIEDEAIQPTSTTVPPVAAPQVFAPASATVQGVAE